MIARIRRISIALGLQIALVAPAALAAAAERVEFFSRDGSTRLVGYVFAPTTPPPWPAVVMLHGRSGPYSALAKGVYDASTLSMRHKQWGAFWAERGYLALHVDSFGPRGHAQGFPFGSYASRPAAVSEQTVRPLDAYGALDYLRRRDDIVKDRIGLQGWSNGAMTGLASLGPQAPGARDPTPVSAFRAALLFYPGCRIQAEQDYRPYTPTVLFIGSDDEEVAALACRQLVERTRTRGVEHFELVWYDGATHSFDDPGKRRQSVEANRSARSDAMRRSEAFFRQHLRE